MPIPRNKVLTTRAVSRLRLRFSGQKVYHTIVFDTKLSWSGEDLTSVPPGTVTLTAYHEIVTFPSDPNSVEEAMERQCHFIDPVDPIYPRGDSATLPPGLLE